jgi:hypothetical protein
MVAFCCWPVPVQNQELDIRQFLPMSQYVVSCDLCRCGYSSGQPLLLYFCFSFGQLYRYIWTEWFPLTVRQLNRWRIDPPFSFLPSLFPLFLYLSPFSSGLLYILSFFMPLFSFLRNSRGRDRMVVGFTTTYAISDYRH